MGEPLLLCAEIVLEHEDGALRPHGQGRTWRTSAGPVMFSHIYAGEDFDARRKQPGWDTPGFDDRAWQPARVAPPPGGESRAAEWPPFETEQRFSPASVKQPAAGVCLYSFPQNCSAQLRVELAGGKPGDKVAFRCGEQKIPRITCSAATWSAVTWLATAGRSCTNGPFTTWACSLSKSPAPCPKATPIPNIFR